MNFDETLPFVFSDFFVRENSGKHVRYLHYTRFFFLKVCWVISNED